MSFYLYKISGDSFTRVAPLKMTGKQGLIAQFLQSHAGEDTPYAWQAGLKDFLAFFNSSLEADSHELVFDMLPEALTEVCLYRVVSFRGVSDFDETDMVMSCRILEQGPVQRSVCDYKEQFTLSHEPSPRQLVEAFHLTGGVATGTYYWGKPKMDIGAAICPPALSPQPV
jgi:hypothetical protein